MPLFITFEGGEGSGKSTQAKLLAARFEREGIPVLLTHEPGGTDLGNRIRSLLKKQVETSVSPSAELFLFAASRAQIVTEVIQPNLGKGLTVICDRFAASTVAYQGYGRGLDLGLIRSVNDLATGGLKPDLTILLDIAPDRGLSRKPAVADRFEAEEAAFHARVREGYLKLARAEPKRWLVVDGRLPKSEIARRIWDRVKSSPLPSVGEG
jgi:dTMP kinase